MSNTNRDAERVRRPRRKARSRRDAEPCSRPRLVCALNGACCGHQVDLPKHETDNSYTNGHNNG